MLLEALAGYGFETRPIVAGNFTRNEVMRYMNAEIHGSLDAADRVHLEGLFIGNQHYPLTDAIAAVASLRR